jgi:hypothetical protein
MKSNSKKIKKNLEIFKGLENLSGIKKYISKN